MWALSKPLTKLPGPERERESLLVKRALAAQASHFAVWIKGETQVIPTISIMS